MTNLIFRPGIVKRSLMVALVVGTVLNLINQGDAIIVNGPIAWLKVCLTYMVPYCVATYGAVSAIRSQERQQNQRSQQE